MGSLQETASAVMLVLAQRQTTIALRLDPTSRNEHPGVGGRQFNRLLKAGRPIVD